MRQKEEIMLTQNDIRILSKIFSDYGYVMTTAQLTNEKLFYRDIQRMLEQGLIERIKRGCYHWVEDYGTSEVVIVNRLFSDAVLCMKTDFEARPVFLHDDVRIKAHFLICFLSLVIYRYLERELEHVFTCETIMDKLKTINFADIQAQGFIPLYTCDKLTDALYEICGFDTDFKFITKSHMKTIQKKSKGRK